MNKFIKEKLCGSECCEYYDESYRGNCSVFREYAYACEYIGLLHDEDRYYAELQLAYDISKIIEEDDGLRVNDIFQRDIPYWNMVMNIRENRDNILYAENNEFILKQYIL